ncbi:MAG: hypothetical protein RL083_1569, partial [Pseudomonadota bacterium]
MSEPLSLALLHAAQVLANVDAGQALPSALSTAFEQDRLSPAMRGAVQDISYRSMRRWGCAR